MTGPEHYAAGTALLAQALRDGGIGSQLAPVQIAAAHAHFAAAHVAATADLLALYGQVSDESKQAWREVLAP